MEYYKISRDILNIGRKLIIKMNVSLVNETKNCIYQYEKPGGSKQRGITLTPGSFISFEYKDGNWSKDKSIIINELNLAKVVKGFKNVHKNVYDGDIFAQDKLGKVIIYKEKAHECTEHIRLGTQNILLQPAIILDDSGLTYEGVIMYINNTENYVEMPIDWFDGIIRTLDKIDMFMYSQALLNFYVSFKDNKELMESVEVNKFSTKKAKENKEKFTLVRDVDIFEGLGG